MNSLFLSPRKAKNKDVFVFVEGEYKKVTGFSIELWGTGKMVPVIYVESESESESEEGKE
jgi:hypothetical protein